MANKLGIGDTFPNMTINLVGGGTLDLPDGLVPDVSTLGTN